MFFPQIVIFFSFSNVSRTTIRDLSLCQADGGHWFVLCLPDEGLSAAGAAAEGGGDGAASDGAADAGDREGSSVTGGGETRGHPAAPPAAQRPGQSQLLRLRRSKLL